MKVQSIFAVALMTAISSVMGAPLRERGVEYYTVTKNVVEVVSITSTVWVPPSTAQPTPVPKNDNPQDADGNINSQPAPKASKKASEKPKSSSIPLNSHIEPVIDIRPTTTSTSQPAITAVYTPVSTKTPTVESSPSPEPASQGSSTGLSHEGRATYYDPGVGVGSCGQQHTNDDKVVAISHVLFDAQGVGNPNNNPLCGRKIKCTREGGSSVVVEVVDRCPGCGGDNDLDFSLSAFKGLGGTEDEGHFQFTWEWVGGN
jgi:hypothetical protein